MDNHYGGLNETPLDREFLTPIPNIVKENLSSEKPFDKDAWLQQLSVDIEDSSEWLETSEGDEIHCISIEELQGILSKYFPNVKLINHE